MLAVSENADLALDIVRSGVLAPMCSLVRARMWCVVVYLCLCVCVCVCVCCVLVLVCGTLNPKPADSPLYAQTALPAAVCAAVGALGRAHRLGHDAGTTLLSPIVARA